MRRITLLTVMIMLTFSLSACAGGGNGAVSEPKGEEAPDKETATDVPSEPTPPPHTEHVWTNATFDAPKTCTECGETEGEPLKLTAVEINQDIEFSMIVGDELLSLEYNDDTHGYDITLYDFEGNMLRTYSLPMDSSLTGYVRFMYRFDKMFYNVIYIPAGEDEAVCTGYVMSGEGELLGEYDIPGSYYIDENYSINIDVLPGGEYATLIDIFGTEYGGLDMKNYKFLTSEEMDALSLTESLEPGKYKNYFGYDYVGNVYLASEDGSSWSYVSLDGSVIDTYVDASNFTSNGFAAVTRDGVNYDIIDTEFNVVGTSVFQNDNARVHTSGGYTLTSVDAEDNETIYMIQ